MNTYWSPNVHRAIAAAAGNMNPLAKGSPRKPAAPAPARRLPSEAPAHWKQEIARHEAAHCVASYLQGLKIEKVEVGKSNGLMKSASNPSEDSFAHALSTLAGNAFMRSIGLPEDDECASSDFVKACFLVQMAVDETNPKAGKEAFGVVLEATHALVRTPRFIELVAWLYPKLAEKFWHYGPDIEKFLRAHDPDRPAPPSQHKPRSMAWAHGTPEMHSWPPMAPVSRHLHDDGTVTLYSHGRLIVSRASADEVEQLSREILG